ncbi:GtrA family protein [Allobranchiibius sp. CTAmp26]|uniref:GtrA family protein n=1 Tax=Allobranchiibius sp. CTAmp26 TaxID=2815214 RepID=UPI0027DC1A76|nr:GtrA family protein [Allobranchiibius sp. CTAmp26]
MLQRLRLTLDVLWRELAKFGVIGLISFVIDLGGFNLLVNGELEHKVTTAKIVSGAVATVFAWLGNRYWTFRHRRNRPVHHEVVLFFVVNGIALAVSAGWVALAHYAFHARGTLALNFAAFIGIGFGTLFRFWAYRRFVFAHEPDVTGEGEAGSEGGSPDDGATQDVPDGPAQSVVAADKKSAKTAG